MTLIVILYWCIFFKKNIISLKCAVVAKSHKLYYISVISNGIEIWIISFVFHLNILKRQIKLYRAKY